MPYCNSVGVASSATSNTFGGPGTYILNSTFAPGGSSGAHQPYGRDLFASFYSKYKVRRVTVTLTCPQYNAGAGVYMYGVCLMAPQDPFTINGASVQALLEKPTGFIMYNNYNSANTRRFVVDIGKYSGLSAKQFAANVEDFSANVGASPTAQVTMMVATANNIASAVTTSMDVRFDMEVEWYERAIQAQS